MKPFSITCTTCKSRLKVRDESAIGEILACPKCSSMVLVEAPAGFVAAAAAKSVPTSPPAGDSSVDCKSFDDVDALIDGQDAAETTSAKDPNFPATYVETKEPPPLPDEHEAPAEPQDSTAVLPGSHWSSPAARKRLMIVGGGLAGLVLAIGMFAIVIANTKDDPPLPNVASADDPPDKDRAKDGANPTPDVPKDANDPPKDSGQLKDSNRDTTADGGPPKDNGAKVTPPPKVEPKDDRPVIPKVGANKDDSPPGLEPVDPPDDKTDGNAKSLLKDLEAFGDLLEDAGFEFSEKVVDDEPAPADAVDDGPPLEKPAPRTIDVAARLDDKFLGIDFKDVPLSVYLQDLSDLSTIPITMEPEVFAWANVSPHGPVGVHLTDAKISDMLSAVLKPLKLTAVPAGGHVRITWPQRGLQKVVYDVEDLTGGNPVQTSALQKLLQKMVAPKSWEEFGGEGTIGSDGNSLTIDQTDAVHYRVLVCLEKLRVARDLPPRSTGGAARFAVATRQARAQAKLSTPITMNFVQPVRLVEILERIQQATKLTVLVDWQATSEVGWTVDTELPFSADNQPVGEALAALLRRMELTYRIVDQQTLQITTPKALSETTDFEVYAVSDLLSDKLSANQLMDGLQTTLGAVHFFDNAGAMLFDGPSQSLLVTLPQPQQLALAKLLENLRASGK